MTTRLSVVTTSLNAMPYIRDTVHSVLAPSAGDIEYIIIDAGSTDGTLEFLRSIADDRLRVRVVDGIGQYDAISLGFSESAGDVLAWINADDLYFAWTVPTVSGVFRSLPDVRWLTGLPAFVSGAGEGLRIGSVVPAYPRKLIESGWYRDELLGSLQQEGMFWRRDLWEETGGFSLGLEWAADFDLWTRFARVSDLTTATVPLGCFRVRGGLQRSVSGHSLYCAEIEQVVARFPKPNALVAMICGLGTLPRCAARLVMHGSSPYVNYSKQAGRWHRALSMRPISRYSLPQLRMEAASRNYWHQPRAVLPR